MQLPDALSSSLENLRGHPLRTVLTMLGMIFGVGAVIAMLAIGAGAERQALEMIESLGVRNVLVRARVFDEAEAREARESSVGVGERDAVAIADAVPGVAAVASRVSIEPWAVVSEAGRADPRVSGVGARHDELFGLELAEGRFLDEWDVRDHAQVAVLGAETRRALFGFEPAVGRAVKVDDLWLTVIGVLAAGGRTADDEVGGVAVGTPDRQLLVPHTTIVRKLERDPLASPLDEIVVEVEAGADPTTVAHLIEGLLDRLHAGVDDWEVVVPEALLEQSRRTQRLFTAVMAAIAGISLLVGGIGITNIMLATVLERTREIGVRRAVGATRVDVRGQFLIEAFTISVLGGLIGIVAGISIAAIVAASAGWPTVVTPLSVALSFGVSVAVGLAAGYYPAARAAELDPIVALRYE